MNASFLYRLDAWLVTGVAMVWAVLAWEVGFRIANRRQRRIPGAGRAGIGAVEGIAFGLFGLLAAFTFSFTINRSELRQDLVVLEANAIATSYQRSAVMPPPVRGQLEALHRRYVTTRMAYIEAGADRTRMLAALADSKVVQDEIWARSAEVAAGSPGSSVYAILLEAQNDMFAARRTRLSALRARLPDAVVVVLLVTAVLTASLTGYALGLKSERHPVANLIFLMLTAAVLYLILDMDRPRRGFLRTQETAMVELAESLGVAPSAARP